MKRHIYCIEGHHNWEHGEVDPSVEPMLQLLQSMGQYSYARRNCATQGEWNFWIENEWNECPEGSILYIAAHGIPGFVELANETPVSIHGLSYGKLKCEGCLVHFSACSVLADKEEDNVRKFMSGTGASYVTGYGADIGWADIKWAPALALELILFSSIHENEIHLDDERKNGVSKRKLKEIAKEIKRNTSFKKCDFKLFTKWD